LKEVIFNLLPVIRQKFTKKTTKSCLSQLIRAVLCITLHKRQTVLLQLWCWK